MSAKIRERLNIDYKKLEDFKKTKDEKVAEILLKAVEKCNLIIKEAEIDADEILSSYGAKLVIKNNVEYNILEKGKKS